MPCPITSPDLITSHHRRVAGTGEAADRVGKAPWGHMPAAAIQPTEPMETKMIRILATAAVLAISLAAAQADPADRGDSMAVPLGDLDLTQPADARVLEHKLRQAAKVVCPSGDILQHSYCVDRATRDAFNQVLARQAAAGGAGKLVRR